MEFQPKDQGDRKRDQTGDRPTSSTTDEVRAKASDIVDSLKDEPRNAAEQQKRAGADQISKLARAAESAAAELGSDMPQAAHYVRDAAARLDRMAASVRERNVEQLMGSLDRFARAQPMAFLGGAVLAGFALARFLKSSGDSRHQRT
jgi:ABC-type transporter Mla subunit MlaD